MARGLFIGKFIENNFWRKTNMTESTLTKFPYRFDVVGSLLRPADLKQAHKDLAEGKITAADLQKIQRDETKRVV